MEQRGMLRGAVPVERDVAVAPIVARRKLGEAGRQLLSTRGMLGTYYFFSIITIMCVT